ncbi:MAG: MlaD family protein [Alphaproteobacteria bacterium]|jgi:phospholipid/cholesterol/gamma-HCH transport system substrate-binding protein|nr:MlaD family protein [Alphaproteobacteria bacterium]
MRNHKLNYAAVGLFVIAMLGTALVAAVALTGRGVERDGYVVVLDNVADIKFGTQVRFDGYLVGQVETIRPLVEADRTRFRLEVSVQRGWRIPADSVARIGSSNFLGAKTVDIAQGNAREALEPGQRIVGAAPADMFAALADVAADIGDLSRNDLKRLLARVSTLVETGNSLLENDMRQILGSAGGVARDLEQRVPAITGELVAFSKELNETVDRAQKLLSDRNIKGTGRVVRNVEEVSRRLIVISAEVETNLEQVDGILSDVGRIVAANEGKVDGAIADARYTLQAIARNIDSINHNLSGAARNMSEFSRLIRQNPGLLLDSSPRREVKSEPAVSLSRRDEK